MMVKKVKTGNSVTIAKNTQKDKKKKKIKETVKDILQEAMRNPRGKRSELYLLAIATLLYSIYDD